MPRKTKQELNKQRQGAFKKFLTGVLTVFLAASLSCSMVPAAAFADQEQPDSESVEVESKDTETIDQTQNESSSTSDTDSTDKASKKASTKKTKTSAKQKAAEKKKAAKQKKVKKAKAAVKKMNSLTTKLELAYEDLNEVNTKVVKLKKRIKKAKSDKKTAAIDLVSAEEKMNDLVKESYTDGKVRYMSVLLNATDFGDFVSRLLFLEILADNEADTINRVKKLKKKIVKSNQSLKEDLSEQQALEEQAEAEAQTIENSLKVQAKYFNSLDEDIQEAVLEDDGIKDSLSDDAGMSGSTSTKGSHPKAAARAMKYLGVKYVWGGATPKGFDCSGLTMYVYAKLGISLTHYARTQYDEGKHISRVALMPGDLVFFGDDVASIHHVGIYIGNDQFIHAPHTGDVVKISTLSSRSDYVGACRPSK